MKKIAFEAITQAIGVIE